MAAYIHPHSVAPVGPRWESKANGFWKQVGSKWASRRGYPGAMAGRRWRRWRRLDDGQNRGEYPAYSLYSGPHKRPYTGGKVGVVKPAQNELRFIVQV